MISSSPSSVSLKRGAVQAFVLTGAGHFLILLMHFIFAQRLGTEDYGVFLYGLSLAGFFAIVLPMGWPNTVLREAIKYEERNDWARYKGLLIRAHQFVILFALFATLILLMIALFFSEGKYSESLVITALLLPFLSLYELRKKIFQALVRIKSSIVPDQVILPSLIILLVLSLGVTSALDISHIYAASLLFVAVFAYGWMWFCLPKPIKNMTASYETRAWLAIALPMLFGSIGQVVLMRVDILVLGLFQSMDNVGIYGAASRIAMLNIFVLGAISTIAAPLLAQAKQKNDQVLFLGILKKTSLWSSLASLPLFLVMIFYPELILSLFGEGFEEGKNILRILAVGHLVNAMVGPVGIALLMSGKEKVFAKSVIIVAVLNIVAHIIITPIYGIYGAALITSTSVICLNLSQFYILRRDLHRGYK